MPRCLVPPNPGGWHYWLAVLVCLLWGAAAYALITHAARRNRCTTRRNRCWLLLSVLGVYLASAIPMSLIVTKWEDRSLYPLLASWALTYLDLIVVPLIVVVCTIGFTRLSYTSPRQPDKPPIWRTKRWIFIAAAIGLAAAVAFHLHDASVYDIFRFDSLSKTFHDLATYFALMGAVVYLFIPVLANPRRLRWLYVVAVVLVIVAVLLLAHESLHPLSTLVYHPPADWNHWGRVIRCVFVYRH